MEYSLYKNLIRLATALLVIYSTSCRDNGKLTATFTTKKISRLGHQPESAERFGFFSSQTTVQKPFLWQEKGATSLRLINYQVDSETECYLTFLKGSGGGLLANINRWRQQLGLDPQKDIPQTNCEFAGEPAVKLEISGSFNGRPNYMIAALIQEREEGLISVKMVGPGDSVMTNRQSFETFLNSINETQLTKIIANDDNKTEQYRNLDWEIPESWLLGPTKPMRNVTFVCGPGKQTEAYITVLSGDGGGVKDNINRWRQQLGLGKENVLKDYDKIDVLGRESHYVKLSGHFKDMNSNELRNAMIIGVICDLRFQTLFVKMVGPAEEVLTEERNFKEFIASIYYRAEKKK